MHHHTLPAKDQMKEYENVSHTKPMLSISSYHRCSTGVIIDNQLLTTMGPGNGLFHCTTGVLLAWQKPICRSTSILERNALMGLT